MNQFILLTGCPEMSEDVLNECYSVFKEKVAFEEFNKRLNGSVQLRGVRQWKFIEMAIRQRLKLRSKKRFINLQTVSCMNMHQGINQKVKVLGRQTPPLVYDFLTCISFSLIDSATNSPRLL
jgi:hypothetical protein